MRFPRDLRAARAHEEVEIGTRVGALHVLLVHAVVVGVPFLAALVVVLAAWPAARRVLWLPTLLGALLLLGLTFLTIEAGEWLEARVSPTPLIQEHTAQGEDIIPWMIALVTVTALVAALAIVERRQRRGRTDPQVAAARGTAPPRGSSSGT